MKSDRISKSDGDEFYQRFFKLFCTANEDQDFPEREWILKNFNHNALQVTQNEPWSK